MAGFVFAATGRQVFRIQAGGDDGGLEEIAVHAGNGVGVDHIGGAGGDNHILELVRRGGFRGVDEACADVAHVDAQRARCRQAAAVADTAAQQQSAIEHGADFRNKSERVDPPGVAAGAGRHQDQAINAGLDGLFRVTAGGHVMEHQTAPAMDLVDQFRNRAKRGDDQRHLVLFADLEVFFDPRVVAVDDQVDAIGRVNRRVQTFLDLEQPVIETFGATLI